MSNHHQSWWKERVRKENGTKNAWNMTYGASYTPQFTHMLPRISTPIKDRMPQRQHGVTVQQTHHITQREAARDGRMADLYRTQSTDPGPHRILPSRWPQHNYVPHMTPTGVKRTSIRQPHVQQTAFYPPGPVYGNDAGKDQFFNGNVYNDTHTEYYHNFNVRPARGTVVRPTYNNGNMFRNTA